MLVGLASYYLVAYAIGAEFYLSANLCGPGILAIILCYGVWRTVASNSAGIWTALVWLRITTVIYFGFGSIVPFIANDATMLRVNHFYNANQEEMLEVNLITALGVLAILCTAHVVARSLKPIRLAKTDGRISKEIVTWGLLFGGVGVVVKYSIVVPYSFGLLHWQVPGFVIQLAQMDAVGIYLIGAWASVNSRPIFALVAAYVVLDAFVGLATFSKTDVLFPMIMFSLVVMSRRASLWRGAAIVGLLIVVYSTVAPIVDFGRIVLLNSYGSITGAPFGERVEIVGRYFAGGKEEMEADPSRLDFQASLARVSYMNQSGFAVHLYDSNLPGHSLEAIAIAVVPRFLWPDKPDMNYLAAGFTELATGSATNLTWPGRYAEVYWNWGWWGVALLMPPLGVVYALLSHYALWVFASQRWAYFPVVLMSMMYGTSITGSYATSGVGGLLYIIVGHFAAKVVESMLDRRAKRNQAVPSAIKAGGPRLA